MAEYDPSTALTAIGTAIAALVSGGLWWRDKQAKKPIEAANDRHELNGINGNDKVLNNLVAEVERMKAREADFEKRITELEERVTLLTNKLASVKLMAIDCYALATGCDCEAKQALLKHLKELIEAA